MSASRHHPDDRWRLTVDRERLRVVFEYPPAMYDALLSRGARTPILDELLQTPDGLVRRNFYGKLRRRALHRQSPCAGTSPPASTAAATAPATPALAATAPAAFTASSPARLLHLQKRVISGREVVGSSCLS